MQEQNGEQFIMEGVIEIDNRVPYQKFQKLRFQEIQFDKNNNNQFIITLAVKYYGLPEDQSYKIVRTLSQINQFLFKMHKFHKHLLLIPAIPQQSGLISIGLKGIKNIFGDSSRKKMKSFQQRKYLLQNIKRAFEFIPNLTLPHLYRINNPKPDTPLYVFIQRKCYELYNSSAFSEEQSTGLQKWGGFLASSGTLLKGMLSWNNKNIQSNNSDLLDSIKESLEKMCKNLQNVMIQLTKFCQNLESSRDNFLNCRQEFGNRSNVIYEKILKVQCLKKTLQLRLTQISVIKQKLNSEQLKEIEDQQIKKQLQKYVKYINDEINEFKGFCQSLMKQLFQVLYIQNYRFEQNKTQIINKQKKRVKIEIQSMYDNYK